MADANYAIYNYQSKLINNHHYYGSQTINTPVAVAMTAFLLLMALLVVRVNANTANWVQQSADGRFFFLFSFMLNFLFIRNNEMIFAMICKFCKPGSWIFNDAVIYSIIWKLHGLGFWMYAYFACGNTLH